jgi:thiamine biosynthesis lipoprotein
MELVTLRTLAKEVHAASAGCFDPTVRPLVRAWGFDTEEPHVPTADALQRAVAAIGIDKLVIIDDEHVRKTVPALELDMSSIGQGYGEQRLANVLEGHGIDDFLVEIGGEVVAAGSKPGREPWRVGVENPARDGGPTPALRVPNDRPIAIVTSGTYRHYLDSAGRRFSHIIDARTGRPVEHSLVAVTVVAENGPLAAAWGTALLCLGPEAAAATAERERLAALWWVQNGSSRPELRFSSALSAEWSGVLE